MYFRSAVIMTSNTHSLMQFVCFEYGNTFWWVYFARQENFVQDFLWQVC